LICEGRFTELEAYRIFATGVTSKIWRVFHLRWEIVWDRKWVLLFNVLAIKTSKSHSRLMISDGLSFVLNKATILVLLWDGVGRGNHAGINLVSHLPYIGFTEKAWVTNLKASDWFDLLASLISFTLLLMSALIPCLLVPPFLLPAVFL
jgi:hypothetical protein